MKRSGYPARRVIGRGGRVGALCALVAMAAAMLLPGLHGFAIDHDCATAACDQAPDDTGRCTHDADHQHDPCPPTHDPSSCEICKLIELLPVATGSAVACGQAWWVHEPVPVLLVTVQVVVAVECDWRGLARGPPAS